MEKTKKTFLNTSRKANIYKRIFICMLAIKLVVGFRLFCRSSHIKFHQSRGKAQNFERKYLKCLDSINIASKDEVQLSALQIKSFEIPFNASTCRKDTILDFQRNLKYYVECRLLKFTSDGKGDLTRSILTFLMIFFFDNKHNSLNNKNIAYYYNISLR